METISERLERLLSAHGSSRRQIALSCGVAPSHLHELASGVKDLRKLAVGPFMDLCAELSTTPEFLLYGQGEEMDKAQSAIEAELLMLFRAVPEDRKGFLLDMLKAAGHSGNDVVA